MKRTLTITTTAVVAIGMMLMLGFAGSAAASPDDGNSIAQSLNQGNSNAQVGGAAAVGDDKATNAATVNQQQTSLQGNIGGNFGLVLDLIDDIGVGIPLA